MFRRLTVASGGMSVSAMKMPVAPEAVAEDTAEAEIRRKKSFQLDVSLKHYSHR